jgi:hypothetical protein
MTDHDYDFERVVAREKRENEIADAYKVLSRALNRGDDVMVLKAIRSEHSTLLGKLGNVVMEAVSERPHDGRLCDFNALLVEKARHGDGRRVSGVRQRFI